MCKQHISPVLKRDKLFPGATAPGGKKKGADGAQGWWRGRAASHRDQQSVDRELLAVVPAPAPIELPVAPPRLLPELLDDPRVVLPGVDAALLLVPSLEVPMPLLAPGLVLPMLLPEDDPIVLAPPEPEPEAEPMALLPRPDEALALLPWLRQGEVAPVPGPMPVALPAAVPALVSAPVAAPLEEVCACTANEARASAALAATRASLGVLAVMSESFA